jgi:hypothetical protein
MARGWEASRWLEAGSPMKKYWYSLGMAAIGCSNDKGLQTLDTSVEIGGTEDSSQKEDRVKVFYVYVFTE